MSTFKPHIVRPAVIIDSNPSSQTCTIQYSDRLDSRIYTCPMPHPFAGAGWGIFTGPTRGTRVMIDTTVGERPFIVGTIAMNQFSNDFGDPSLLRDIGASMSSYPKMKGGEIAIQSQAGSLLHFGSTGTVKLIAGESRLEFNSVASSLSFVSRYENTEAHREVTGLVKRDLRKEPREVEQFLDKLIPVQAEAAWTTVGRNPLLDTSLLTFRVDKNEKATRNPALVEHRSLVYEFARSSMVGGHSQESNRAAGLSDSESSLFLADPNRRDLSRADVFNLGPHLPNNLIERIDGTSVDIYGNILDINRNVIDFSDVDLKDQYKAEHEASLLRRSIKHHVEINVRKHPLNVEGDPNKLDSHDSSDQACANGYSFSRWSIDVDGEGLTKINIPASSNVGNIPLLSRYVNLFDPENRNAGDFRPPEEGERRDIRHIAFGNLEGDGIEVLQTYVPPNITSGGSGFKYRTAYHDLVAVAEKIFNDTGDGPPVSTELNNNLKDSVANAGGRSIHANLDGSLELNVGRDTADKKSLVLDTAGSIISHLGEDKRGNSVVAQTDGDVLVQVGGAAARGENVSESNSVRFYVNSDNGDRFHKIEIRKEGIFITSAPGSNIVMQSENNLVLAAKGQVLIDAEGIFAYGDYDEDGNSLAGERYVERGAGAIK